MRAETNHGVVSVQLFGEDFQRALKVGHCDALVHDQTFDLMENGGMGRVHSV